MDNQEEFRKGVMYNQHLEAMKNKNSNQSPQEKKDGKSLSKLPSGDTNQGGILISQDDTSLRHERRGSLLGVNHPVDNQSQNTKSSILNEEAQDSSDDLANRSSVEQKTI